MCNYDYTLRMSRDQAHLIKNALEFYARIMAGQVEEISYQISLNRNDISWEDRKIIRSLCTEMRKHISTKFDDVPDRAYDLMQTMRFKLSWDEEPGGGKDVRFDKPLYRSCDPPAKLESLEKQF